MLVKFSQFPARRRRGFTLIEIMVTVGIILLLATILLGVGSSVRKNSQITTTRAELKALEGIAEQFERETGQVLPLTYYNNQGQGPGGEVAPVAGTANFLEILYRYPATKDQLVHLAGDKLQLFPSSPGTSYIRDVFGYPIHFIPAGITDPFDGGTTAREYFRSSGPDGISSTTAGSPYNADDIRSTDAIH